MHILNIDEGTKWAVTLLVSPDEPVEILFDVIGGRFTYELADVIAGHLESQSNKNQVCQPGDDQCGQTEYESALPFNEVAYVNNPLICGPPGKQRTFLLSMT